ncbi:MAG: glycosyl hydrolase family 32 [Hyphomicrobiales bacterium]|nr:MAG: glycosyl hydrolase family 32 [Hyphomicrobiales bacterium]
MSFQLADHWVWDFWLADDGERYHLFYLHAPKSLGDPDLRHRNARIGHATSVDLRDWTDHGRIFEPGPAGSFDDTANWTGSVVQGADGKWRLYYTGSRFLSPDRNTNIETIGLAVSDDLYSWTKQPGPIVAADPRWYETLGSSSWPEEAWRDPWVFPDADGKNWHMLITARANHGDDMRRGVVGHAVSTDMEHWEVRPPLSAADIDFAHLEVFQTATIGGRNYILFCCDTPRLSGKLAGTMGGIWYIPVDSFTGPIDTSRARLLAPQSLYAGRFVCQRNGEWALMGFRNDSPFVGGVSDPIPLSVDADGGLGLRGAA